MILTHDIGRSVSLSVSERDGPLWRYVYSGRPKPFFHPLCTPAGHCLTNFEPHDHRWHRGLWFTIKFINQENFWEENPPFGTKETRLPILLTHHQDGSLQVTCKADWVRPAGAGAVFQERRDLIYRAVAEDAYAIDFETCLTAVTDVLLDRTEYTTWGGYGGLTFRGNRNWQETRLLFSDGTRSDRPTGSRGDWADLSGKLDGGPGQTGGITLFDAPSNLRHPTPWYGATGAGHYINAAVLFHEPMAISAGESLDLRYRALVHDGIWDVERIAPLYAAYAASFA